MSSGALRSPATALRRLAVLASALALPLHGDAQGERDELTPAPHAQVQTARDLLAAKQRAFDPADGGGRARLVEGGAVRAGEVGRWRIEYEAGPLGVAEGGGVYLQVSPFWGWSTPQVEDPSGEGFTVVSSEAAGIELKPATIDRQLLAVTIAGRALAPGEQIAFDYGAGPAGARGDLYAESCSRLWIAVDGDGDGFRKVLADSPCVVVLPGPPAQLAVFVPSVARPGEDVQATVSVLDAAANAVREVSGKLELTWVHAESASEQALDGELALEDGGCKRIGMPAPALGLQRLRARLTLAQGVLEALSNPLDVSERAPRVLWADLHGHSAQSDGTGELDEWWRYAREVAALDVAALTDHDHWGLLFLDEHPELWSANVAAARAADRPGRFVALPGYEWTSWLWGHRHVLFFGDETPLASSLDDGSDTPAELWNALRGLDALTVPHHPAGGPVAIDWRIAPDARLEPVVELCSAHGASEAADAPRPIYDAIVGGWTRDALGRGYELGHVASGDGHDGHPGLTHLGPQYGIGGVTAILADSPERGAVLTALRARRTYATSGPRVLLRFALGSAPMGTELKVDPSGSSEQLFVSYAGTARVSEVNVIRSDAAPMAFSGGGRTELEISGALDSLHPGGWVYVRVLQEDGHAAWSSPVFLRTESHTVR